MMMMKMKETELRCAYSWSRGNSFFLLCLSFSVHTSALVSLRSFPLFPAVFQQENYRLLPLISSGASGRRGRGGHILAVPVRSISPELCYFCYYYYYSCYTATTTGTTTAERVSFSKNYRWCFLLGAETQFLDPECKLEGWGDCPPLCLILLLLLLLLLVVFYSFFFFISFFL